MVSKNIFRLFLPLIVLVSAFVIPVFADEQVPASVLIVETDPYYFFEGNFGLKILKFFQRPMTPYLVPGKTTDQSTIQEISDAYNEATMNSDQKPIVYVNNRVTTFVVNFSGGDLKETYSFDSFSKFSHIAKSMPNAPYYYQNVNYGLELESLPSEGKRQFYDELVIPSINLGKKPEPFDIDVALLTGDGSTLQVWKYQECTIRSYTPYLDENLLKLKFVGDFVSEIRDKTAFSCDGFKEDFVLKEPAKKIETASTPQVVAKERRADRIIVQFSGGELTSTNTFYSFFKFVPLARDPNFPVSIPGNVIGEKPRFLLETLPTKDKENYYKFLSRYVNPGKTPELFDATVHLVTGSGKILQSWRYSDCSTNNYVTFFTDNLLPYKFKQSVGSEIREKTFFECNGLELDSDPGSVKVDTKQVFTPNDAVRAQVFVAHFQGPDISPEKTVTSFTKFSPITHEEIQLLLPDSPFGEEPKFYLESLPNKDNQWYYNLMSRYINAGKLPEPFDVTVDVLVGDGAQIQSWKYTDCQVLEYKTYLEDSLFLRKFTDKFEKEFRDRAIFQCTGFALDGNSMEPQTVLEKPLDYVDFIPSEQTRITKMTTTFSGGEIKEPFTINTIGKFTPKMEQRSQTESQLVKLSVAIVPNEKPSSQPSQYDPSSPCAPGEEPPGCKPCPPNNPHCTPGGGDGGGDGEGGGEEIPIEPEEPGISSPTFTVLVTMPHLSVIQKNDYVKSTEFTIKSLPSKDKRPYYDIVSRYINPGAKPEPFDVTFDYQSDDGTIIQSWKYTDCEIKNFDIKLQDNLLYFSLSNIAGKIDIVDVSTLKCNGFSVDFEQKPSKPQETPSIPSPYDSAMLTLVHWYGGELQNQRSSALLQQFDTLPDSDVFVGGLPNIHHKDAYEFVSRYLNPGKSPEPVDMRFDTVTGDGTILFSTAYHDCTVKDSSTYLSDNMAKIRYIPGLKSEIRGQSSIDCIGTSFKTMTQNDPRFAHSDNLRKVSPAVQRTIGIPSEGIECQEGSELMIRPPNKVPICVKSDHVTELEERGWNHPSKTERKNLIDVLRPILPTVNERASSFVVGFEGTDVAPPKTVKTFSKFSPVDDVNSLLLQPSNPLDSSAKSFYLESLPNKENSWYYELASRYVNAGKKPEPFNVIVEVKSGSGDDLQTWKYRECEINDYVSYYDDSLLKYKFHGKWQSEIRDRSIFSCAGLSINSSGAT